MNQQADPTGPNVAPNAASRIELKPKISMRPITTPINILVCGASSTGKSSFIRACAQLLNPQGSSAAAALTSSTGLHAVLADADKCATTLSPILVPEAGRALVYKFQVRCNFRLGSAGQ
jgi:GTPase SAR1 family protein